MRYRPGATMPLRRLVTSLLAVLSALVITLSSARAQADCDGPAECCITDAARVTVPLPEHVRVGMRTMHVHSISESEGTWSGEVTLVLRWPAGGIRPDPLVRNQSSEFNVSVDETTRVGEFCYREKRYSAAFSNWFRLRRFPFDTQVLRIIYEERTLRDDQVIWERELWPNIISIDAYRELAAWRFEDYPNMEVKRSSFAVAPGSVHPRLLIVSIPVARLWQFYLSRFFIPLFLLVALAYSIFWVKPEDLNSAASIGITCMLSIIAFQLTQSDSLPRVGYLTLADRVYVVCYIATAIAIALAIMGAYLADHDKGERARQIDRRLRAAFPLGFVIAVGVAAAMGWRSHNPDPDADIPARLPAAHVPAGEEPVH
jgi:hypothetical protein